MWTLRRFLKAELGQDVVEYVLLCSLLAFGGVGLALVLGPRLSNAYNNIGVRQQNTLGLGTSQGQGQGQGNGQGNGRGNGNGQGNGGDGQGNGNGNAKH